MSRPITIERPLTPGLLLVLGGLAALGALSTNIILPSFPRIAADLGVATTELGVTMSVFFLVFAFAQLLVGPLADRFGRRPVVLAGLTVFVAGSLLSAAAADLATLTAGRAVQAAGVSAASVLSRAIARDLFEGPALARALSLTMVAMAAAPGFSPLLGGGLDALAGWRSAFGAVALAGTAVAILYARRVGETHPADSRVALDLAGILRGYAGLAADRRFILPALAVGLLLGGLFGMFAAAPAILIEGLGLTTLQFGLFFAGSVFLVFAAGLIAPRLAARAGTATAALGGLALALVGGGMLLVLGAPSFPVFLAATSVFLFGMGLANPLGTALALAPFGDRAGLASALLGFLQMGGAGIGVALATGAGGDPAQALGAVQAGFGLAAVLVLGGSLRVPAGPVATAIAGRSRLTRPDPVAK